MSTPRRIATCHNVWPPSARALPPFLDARTLHCVCHCTHAAAHRMVMHALPQCSTAMHGHPCMLTRVCDCVMLCAPLLSTGGRPGARMHGCMCACGGGGSRGARARATSLMRPTSLWPCVSSSFPWCHVSLAALVLWSSRLSGYLTPWYSEVARVRTAMRWPLRHSLAPRVFTRSWC